MKKLSLFIVLIIVISLITSCSFNQVVNKDLDLNDLNEDKNIVEKPKLEEQKLQETKVAALNISDLKSIEKKGYVTTDGLNVRTLGSMQGSVIAVINKGVQVHVFGEKNSWYYVEYAADKKGWVYSKYINLEKATPPIVPDINKIEKKGYVTTNGLNVRTLGSMQGKIITAINKGVQVHVFGEKNGWYYVEYTADKKGWVSSKYIELEKATPPIVPDINKIEKKGYVTTNGLNVRTLGSMQGKIITVINKGVQVHVFGEKNGWYYVEYAADKKGWVSAKYIQFNSITIPPTDTGSLSNTSYSWYFIRNTTHQQPGFDKTYKAILDKYDGVTIGDKNKKDIFLTLDNGYENGYTVTILDILKRQNVKVGFFVQGSYIDKNPEIVKRMVSDGHIVLNHSNTHPAIPTLSKEKLQYEINIVAEKYKNLTGKEMVKFFRPPSGVFSERTIAEVKNLGYRTVFWSMAYQDWVVDDQPGKAASYKHVTDNIHNGAVILLHSISKSNTEALEDIIIELKRQGYNFKLLTQFP